MFLAVVASMTLLVSMVVADCIENSTYIAFSAGFKSDQIISGRQNIAFSEVYINYGSGYNSLTGVFTATKAGLYYFTFHGVTTPTKDFWVEFYHNDVYLVSAFARQGNDYASGGNSIILRLKKNDKVYLQTRRTVYLYGRTDEVYATFSGYMIGQLP